MQTFSCSTLSSTSYCRHDALKAATAAFARRRRRERAHIYRVANPHVVDGGAFAIAAGSSQRSLLRRVCCAQIDGDLAKGIAARNRVFAGYAFELAFANLASKKDCFWD